MSDDLRDGIMNLHTRQFGTAMEILIKLVYRYKDSGTLSYDLKDENLRVEVKSSRVFKQNKLKLTEETLYDLILNNTNRNRLIKHTDVASYDFDCNIQQVKVKFFDVLYYILFFYDVVQIFKMLPEQILNDKNVLYSDKQHQGNQGEGQFHISNKTYKHHKDNYFETQLTYAEIKAALTKKES